MSDAAASPKRSEQFILRDRFLFPKHRVSIGRGATGDVLQALDMRTGRMVAAKTMSVDQCSEQALSTIVREVSLLKSLPMHRNLVQYIGTAREGSVLYIILEHIAGGSLASLLKQYGSLPEQLARRYIADTLEGLRFLHAKKIAHRDLKCENLILCSSGAVKLVDFGCSREYSDGEQAMTVLGSPLFMAPEVASARGPYDPFLADIWTVGMTLIQMLTGKVPFANECPTPMRYFMMISKDDFVPPIPPGVSASCVDFLHRCVVRDPTKRASLEELLYHEFIEGVDEDNTIPAMS